MKSYMMAFHQFTSVKKHVPKNIFHNGNAAEYFFINIFLVPYAFIVCNLRVGNFDASASNMIIFCVNISSSSG